MDKSPTIKELATALCKFQSEVSAVKKDGNNPYFKSKYATLENILETIKTPLKNAGLSFVQLPCGDNELSTIIMHISGEFIQSVVKMNPKDNTPQGQGSAITYMRRYALSSALGIATEEDDDGNHASGLKSKTPVKSAFVEKSNPKKDWKQLVKEACDTLNPILKTKEEYEKFVFDRTGFPLLEENADDIIAQLKFTNK